MFKIYDNFYCCYLLRLNKRNIYVCLLFTFIPLHLFTFITFIYAVKTKNDKKVVNNFMIQQLIIYLLNENDYF